MTADTISASDHSRRIQATDMSLNTAAQSSAEAHAGDDSSHAGGQRHDRFEQDYRGIPLDDSNDMDQGTGLTDTSMIQKMASAVLGSVLTSLLGK